MAYESVKNQIDAYIKANGVNLITGSVLNAVLTTMLDELGEGYAFQGVLNTTDTTSPAADIPQAWLASAGTYIGGSITVDEGELALILHTADGWSKVTVYRGVQLSQEAIVDALGYTPADEADLAEKQDTIADLSDIRSGAALGETSVQPADIENMVEAEPIGSIIPPVNPSEFATKEELSQLGQEVGDLADLETTDKSSIVAAINDLRERIGDGFFETYTEIDLSQLTEQNCSLGGNGWYNAGAQKHIAIPVTAGARYKLSLLTYNGVADTSKTGWYVFVTSSYSPPYSNNQAIPKTGAENRIGLSCGSNIALTAPSNAAYLILTVVDGGAKRCVWALYSIAGAPAETVEDSINGLDGRVDELEEDFEALSTWEILTGLQQIGYYINNSNTWNNYGNYRGSICSMPSGARKLSVTKNPAGACRFAFLTDNTMSNGGTPAFCPGTSLYEISSPDEQIIDIPSGCNYLYVYTYSDGTNVTPALSILRDTTDTIVERVENLEKEVNGELGEITATWENWALSSSSPYRAYTICDSKAALGGTISVKLSSYSTYKIGVVIQDGTAWSSTAISDTGWKTENITKVIASNEAGFNIRVTIGRVDNQSINLTEFLSVISELEYIFTGNTNGLNQRVEALENPAQRIPMKVIGTHTYVGRKVDVSEHTYTSASVGSLSNPGTAVQGFAVYGDYLFQCHNTNNAVVVFKLSTGAVIQTIYLTANANNHANSAGFGGQKYNNSDPLPCLYISSEGEKKVYVYRVTGTEGAFSLTLVQTITFDVPFYYPNMHIDAPNHRGVVVGYSANTWQDATANKMLCCCFDLPDVTAGDKTLSVSYGEFSFPFIYAAQGAMAKYGKLYAAFGNTSAGLNIGGVLVIDYISKNVESFIDLKAVGNLEPEGASLWDNGIVITTQDRAVIKLTF